MGDGVWVMVRNGVVGGGMDGVVGGGIDDGMDGFVGRCCA